MSYESEHPECSSSEFNYCCGMAELGNFDALEEQLDTETEYRYGEGLSPFSKAQQVKYYSDGIKEAMDNSGGKGSFIATTIPRQKLAILALTALKFKPVKRFHNPGSGSTVTLWVK